MVKLQVTKLQALKNDVLKIETQISTLKSHVKCEVPTLTDKTETMSLNLGKTVNAQQESVNKNVEFLEQNISYLQKELNYKIETIKSLLKVQSPFTEQFNKPPGYTDLQWSLNKISQCQLLAFKTNVNAKVPIIHLDFGKIYKLI